MKALSVLEEKISFLLNLAKELKAENGALKEEREQLKAESARLIDEKTKIENEKAALHKNVEQLTEELEAIKTSMLANDKSVDVLNQEKAETKLLINDLINDIDSLVESENQQ